MPNPQQTYLQSLVEELRKLPRETEWVEFKHNNTDPDMIGERLSALANSAALEGKTNAYLIWGIEDETHNLVGSLFKPDSQKVGNEALASLMRRVGICEERGSGIDKVVHETEIFQLPAPIFETTPEHTRTVLFAHKEFEAMTTTERVHACYLHACLRYLMHDYMTNESLRERFGLTDDKIARASRIISSAKEKGLIVPAEAGQSNKFARYLPHWAT